MTHTFSSATNCAQEEEEERKKEEEERKREEEDNLESAVMMFSPSELEEELLDSKTDLSAMVLTKVP